MRSLEDSVIDFVADFTAAKRTRISLQTTLFGDLGIDGADGWELIEAFGRKFDVDIATFRPERHFGPEGLPIYAPLALIWWLITWPWRRPEAPEASAGLQAIRISDLVVAARTRKWTLDREPQTFIQ